MTFEFNAHRPFLVFLLLESYFEIILGRLRETNKWFLSELGSNKKRQ